MKIIIVGLLFILVSGCSSTKDFYSRKGELKNITDAKLVKSVEDNYLIYNSLFFKKFSAEVVINGEKTSFKGNLYLDNNEIIVSILPLMGIEIARVRFSPDLIEIMDRTKKTYTKSSYQFLWTKFLVEMDYFTLKSILTNQLHTYPISEFYEEDLKKYKHYIKGDFYELNSLKKGKIKRKYKSDNLDNVILHELTIMPEIFKISKSYIKDFGANTILSIDYSDFFKVNDSLFANTIKIDGTRGNASFSIMLKFDSVEIDSKNVIGFKVSDKYKVQNL